MSSRAIPLVVTPLALAAGFVACGPESDDPSGSQPLVAEDVCRKWCLFLQECNYYAPGDEDCRGSCMYEHDYRLEAYPPACASAYLEYFDCYADLTCSEFSTWLDCEGPGCPIPCPEADMKIAQACG